MNSILQEDKSCYVCRSPYVECHHVMYGTANRKLSDRYGLTVWLCAEHHRGNNGVHHNKKLDLQLKQLAEEKFNEIYPWNFRRIFYGDGIEELRNE